MIPIEGDPLPAFTRSKTTNFYWLAPLMGAVSPSF